MIPQSDIDRIYDLDITAVIDRYVSIKKRGANYWGNCPFHDEKTGSFSVNPARNIFKCFGCGKGGGAISFVMEHEKLNYPDAIRKIAADHKITITERELTDEEKQIHDIRESLTTANNIAANYFVDSLGHYPEAINYIAARFKKETIQLFQVGFARDHWHDFQTYAKASGLKEEILLKAGLLSESKEKLFNFFRNRIIFPIHNKYGNVIGFSGRVLKESADSPKYINTPETAVYSKSKTLFGINLAHKAIQQKDNAYLVEGNTDVMRLHDIEIENSIGTCGTSLTYDHIAQLKKLSQNVTLIFDGDNAGIKATIRAGIMLIENNMNCNVIILPYNGIDKTDPDSFFTTTEIFTEYEAKHKQKFIDWQAENIAKSYDESPEGKARFVKDLTTLLAKMPDSTLQQYYADKYSKQYKIQRRLLKQEIEQALALMPQAKDEKVELPDNANEEDVQKFGFYEEHNSYRFISNNGPVTVSNFVINPLFHIYSKTDNKRLIEITNEFGHSKIVDVPSDSFISFEQFQKEVFKEGHFIFFGTKQHFIRIMNKIGNNFPLCCELKTLGWQREGFYAFANGIFNGTWKHVDKYGITEHDEQKFFSPAFSMVYKDVREDDDEYENDRYFQYHVSPVSFNEWADLMIRVYGDEKGIIAVAFFIASLFRDLIYEKYKIFPHLFLFGEKQSGKSQLGWSLSNVFLNGQPAFNLSSGTNVGFFRKLARFRNSIVWYDEYTNDVDEKRFQALKAAYDGIGHEKGKMTRDNRTEITKVNAACIISGQYLPTRDDNALFTRSILLSFSKKQYNTDEIKDFERLKELEDSNKGGLSSMITELLPFRELIDKKFGREFSEIFDRMKNQMLKEEKNFEERLIRNFVTIITPVKILLDANSEIHPGFSYEKIYNLAVNMVHDLSGKISNSEALASFWKLIEYMLDSRMIEADVDFKIETAYPYSTSIPYLKNGEKTMYVPEAEEKLLYIKFSKIHPVYMELHRKMHGVNGVDLTSLMHYISTSKAFIGLIQSTRFKNSNTSAYIFRYDLLNVNLDRHDTSAEAANESFFGTTEK